jgi:hypothetical protein
MTRYTDDEVHDGEEHTVNSDGVRVYPNGDGTWSTLEDLDEDAAEYHRMCAAGENVYDIELEEFIENRRRSEVDVPDESRAASMPAWVVEGALVLRGPGKTTRRRVILPAQRGLMEPRGCRRRRGGASPTRPRARNVRVVRPEGERGSVVVRRGALMHIVVLAGLTLLVAVVAVHHFTSVAQKNIEEFAKQSTSRLWTSVFLNAIAVVLLFLEVHKIHLVYAIGVAALWVFPNLRSLALLQV